MYIFCYCEFGQEWARWGRGGGRREWFLVRRQRPVSARFDDYSLELPVCFNPFSWWDLTNFLLSGNQRHIQDHHGGRGGLIDATIGKLFWIHSLSSSITLFWLYNIIGLGGGTIGTGYIRVTGIVNLLTWRSTKLFGRTLMMFAWRYVGIWIVPIRPLWMGHGLNTAPIHR